MAKVTKAQDTPTKNLPATETDLYAGYSDEEKAELLALTGQVANLKGDKVPILKVSYLETDMEDRDGNSIKKGNFVYNQNSKEVASEGDEDVKVEYVGVDMGKTTDVTILAYRQQYAFYSDDPKKRCSSQIFGAGETPVGNNLGFECRSGKCPRRAEGVDKKEKCSCQYVVMAKAKVNDESKPAMMYVKGKSFITFGDYLKAAGSFPLFFAPTKLTNKMEKQGSVTYFVTSFELLKDQPYPQIEGRENMQNAKDAIKSLEDFKSSQAAKPKNSSASDPKLVDKSAGKTATNVSNFEEVEDDINFDDED